MAVDFFCRGEGDPPVDETAEIKGSPSRRYTSPLDLGRLVDYTRVQNDREVTITRSLHTRRRSTTVTTDAGRCRCLLPLVSAAALCR